MQRAVTGRSGQGQLGWAAGLLLLAIGLMGLARPAAAQCVDGIEPISADFAAAGGSGEVSVTTDDPKCEWSGTASANWITLTSGSGTGSGTLTYTVAANTSATARSATIAIGTFEHTVNQAGAACAVTAVSPASASFGGSGGSGAISVTVNGPQCPWSGSTSANWISLTSGSGTGSGILTYTVGVNPQATPRSGTIVVAGFVHTVNQAAGACAVTSLSPLSASYPAAGGDGAFAVAVNGAACPWSGSTEADWITLIVGSGTGGGTLTYSVAENTQLEARTGTITVGSFQHTVTQAAGTCTVLSVDPATAEFGTAGGKGSVAIAVNDPSCTWTASVDVAWITLDETSGTGDDPLTYTVAANGTADTREGAISIGGLSHVVTQTGTACEVTSLSPLSVDFAAAGGTGVLSVGVNGSTCPWSASVDAGWVTLTTDSGTGSGLLIFEIETNSGFATRTATITVGPFTAEVSQSGQPCAVTGLDPGSVEFAAEGGAGSVEVSVADPLCEWTATTSAEWIALTSGSGTGGGTLQFTVDANPSAKPREATIEVGDLLLTVGQTAAACEVTGLAPASAVFESAGGSGSVMVMVNGTECPWEATTDADWIEIAKPEGTGGGPLAYIVLENDGITRTGTIEVGGFVHSIVQNGEGCAVVEIAPESAEFDAKGGPGSVAVTMSKEACTWSAAADVDWITLSNSSGSGNGTLNYTVAANPSAKSRSGSITLGGLVHSVTQEGGACEVVEISPATATFEVEGGEGSVSVVVNGGECPWSASTDADWITLVVDAGTGGGAVEYEVAANDSGDTRTGTIEIGGLVHTVTQNPVCEVTAVSPPSASFGAEGGGGVATVTVTAAGCSWSAAVNVDWIELGTSGGTGSGTLEYTVEPNGSAEPREGRISIGGFEQVVSQAAGECAVTAIEPESASFGIAGGGGAFTVTVNGPECAWEAVADVEWIRVDTPKGVGSGTVEYSIEANDAESSRQGTITIGGLVHLVDQAGTAGCAIPTQIEPIGEVDRPRPTYRWSVVIGATWYQLQVEDSTGEVLRRWYTAEQVGAESGECSITPPQAVALGDAQWRVRAWLPDEGNCDWSPRQSFRVVQCGPVDLIAPTGPILATTPTYRWAPRDGATWYQLWVNDSTGNIVKRWYTAEQVGAESGECSITPTESVALGSASWWVRAWSAETGNCVWSDAMTFEVIACGVPTLASPSGPTPTATPTYRWSAVEGATWYQVQVTSSSGTILQQWYAAESVCGEGAECSVMPPAAVPSGTSTWRVRAWAEETGSCAWSASVSFSLGLVAPTQISPSGDVSETTPTYRWSVVEGATWYQLWVNDSSGNILQQWYTAAQVGAESGECSITPPVAPAPGVATWWVRAWNPPVGNGPWSPGLTFQVVPGCNTFEWRADYGVPGMNGTVRALFNRGTGELVAGGDFTQAGGIAASRIAVQVGSSWAALGSGFNGAVRALADLPGGDLVAAGEFTGSGGTSLSRIARWNGSSWQPLGSGVNGTVHALVVLGNGDLVAGGEFTTAGGLAASRIARWDGSAWSALGSGVNGPVFALAASGNAVIAGGAFTTAGGSSASRIARWDGSSWSTLGSGVNGSVLSIAIGSGNTVFVGGEFTTAGGTLVNRIARWNGSAWSDLFGGTDGPVRSLWFIPSNGYLIAGGDFVDAGGVFCRSVAAYAPGGPWEALDFGVAGDVRALVVRPADNNLIVGGFITGVGILNTPSFNIGRYGCPPLQTSGSQSLAGVSKGSEGPTLAAGPDRVVARGEWFEIGAGVSERLGVLRVEAGGGLRLFEGAELQVASLTLEPGATLEWFGGTIEILGGSFEHAGSIAIGCFGEATLDLRGGAVVLSPLVEICSAGTLRGEGVIGGSLRAAGTIEPQHGGIEVLGSLETLPGSLLLVPAPASTTEAPAAAVRVGGKAVLGGLVEVAAPGQWIEIIERLDDRIGEVDDRVALRIPIVASTGGLVWQGTVVETEIGGRRLDAFSDQARLLLEWAPVAEPELGADAPEFDQR